MNKTKPAAADLTSGRPFTQNSSVFSSPGIRDIIPAAVQLCRHRNCRTLFRGRRPGSCWNHLFPALSDSGIRPGRPASVSASPLPRAPAAKSPEQIHRYLWNGFWLCSFMALILTLVMVNAAAPLLSLIHTPEGIFPMAVEYVVIIFWGIPASILYNYSASALRALGTPDIRFTFFCFPAS